MLLASTLYVDCSAIAKEGHAIPPKPARKSQALKSLNSYIETVEKKQAVTKQEMKSVEEELAETKDKLSQISSKTLENEKSLIIIEKDIANLLHEKKVLQDKLDTDRVKMGNVILAMQRIERMPTETMIARPGAPIQTAQTALLLQSALPTIQHDAQRLSKDISRLNNVEKDLRDKKARQKSGYQELLAHRNEVRNLLKQRSRLYKQLESDFSNTEKSLANMAKQANDLQELMAALKKQKVTRYKNSKTVNKPYPTPLPSLGKPQLPAQGFIQTGYKQTDHIGAVSQGIHIQGRPNGLIVAPMGGVVKFASQFKHYGNMVIISHKNDYFSLIAGFDDIDIEVGQSVKAGEAIGSLPLGSSRSGQPTLYYELRYKGKTIDPAKKISGLKS